MRFAGACRKSRDLRVFGERTLNDGVHRRVHASAHAGQRRGLLVVDVIHHDGLRWCIEGWAAGDQVVEHRAERIDVGAAIERVAVELFG